MLERNITRIKNGAGAGGGVEGQSSRRDIDNFPANPNTDQVDIVEGWSPRILEKRSKLDPNGLGHRPKPERAGEVGRFEAGQAVGEGGLV